MGLVKMPIRIQYSGMVPKMSISNELPSEAYAASQQTTLGGQALGLPSGPATP